MESVQIDSTAVEGLLHGEQMRSYLEQQAYAVEGAAKRLVRMHGEGRVYTTTFWRDAQGRLRRGGRRVPHQASAPGAPPATDTGRLLNSIGHVVAEDGRGVFADVYARVSYATYLELGTRHMAARPFLRPALRALRG